MAGWTNVGAQRTLEWALGRRTKPTNFYIALCTAAAVPGQATAALASLTQIASGNGYSSGGYPLNPTTTDFDESGIATNKGYIRLKNIQFTANGGAIPASGDVPKYAVLTDDNNTVANRETYYYWDLGTLAVLNEGQILSLEDFEIRIPS